jgi:hypothetical protein
MIYGVVVSGDWWEGALAEKSSLLIMRSSGGMENPGLKSLRENPRAQAEKFGKAERRTADPSTTLRSGRDDNSSWKRHLAFPTKIVIPTGA